MRNPLKEHTLVERSSEDSTYNEGSSYLRNAKEDVEISSTLKQRRGGETSTSRKNMSEFSSNEEYEICLRASFLEDTIPGIEPSFAQIFKMSSQLDEENAKLREFTIGLKKSLI